MKKPNPLAIAALSVVAVSVLAFTINDGLKNRKEHSFATSTKGNPISTSPFVAYNPPHGKPGHRHDLPDGAPLPGVTPNQNSGASGNLPFTDTRIPQPAAAANTGPVNPPHGQPGHRCEIAVGAPLNSAPAPTTAAAPQINASSIAAPSAGLNPEHGKPGHRCDIAVGAPLNSAPATASKPSVVSTTSASSPKAAPGMNPAHGQPGHRCDIAVGAPLNSAPATSATTTTTATNTNPQLFPNYNFPAKESPVITPIIQTDSASVSSNPAQ